MYDFSGFFLRMMINGGIIFFIGVLELLVSCFWNKYKRKKKQIVCALFFIGYALIYTGDLYLKILNPVIKVHEGCFLRENRKRKSLLVGDYCFSNGSEKSLTFELDSISKRKIYDAEFKKNKRYKIYYEEDTNIIVRVEEVA